MILKVNNKDYSFTATMKNIVKINEKSKVSNLRDAFFKAANNVDFKFLAEILMNLADTETKKELNDDYNKYYDLIETYVTENDTDYESLYSLVAKEVNDKSFFGKKMSEEELTKKMQDPLVNFDMDKAMNNALTKVMSEEVIKAEAEGEFKGYKG